MLEGPIAKVRNSSSTMFASSGQRLKRAANTIWKVRSSDWIRRSNRSAQASGARYNRGAVLGPADSAILRAELRRLFGWLKDKVTAIITAERGEGSAPTRFGIEEYVSDCVILLDNRVLD